MFPRLMQKTTVFLVYLFLYAPIMMLILMSFNTSRYSSFPAPGWSLKWYIDALNDEAIVDAAITSTIIALIVAVIATTLGTLASLALVRFRMRGRIAFQTLFMAPLPIPEVVIAIALLVAATTLDLGGGAFPVIAGHVLMGLPFVVTIVSARLYGVDASLDEAAMDLGANGKQILWRIVLPLAAPGIIGGFILAFTVSFDNFLVSHMVGGSDLVTIPTKIYSMLRFEFSPKIHAASTMIITLTVSLLLLHSYVTREK
jgi:spermidine/putrescine transport system permease protein